MYASSDPSIQYQYRYTLTRRERATLWLLAVVTVVVGVIFSIFFALGLNLTRTDIRLYTAVTLVLASGYWLAANILVVRYTALFTLCTSELQVRYPFGFRPWHSVRWPTERLQAVGLLINERGVAELGLFGNRTGDYAFFRLSLPPEAIPALRQWAAGHGIRCFTEKPEYADYLQRVGLEHDFA